MQPVLDYSELRAPPGQGEVLVAPAPQVLPEMVEENRRYLERHVFRVLDVSSLECRSMVRAQIHSGLVDRTWIVTGHQPEFTYPGIWAKHVVTQRLADHLGGVAANLVVDHDAVKSTALVVPSESHGRWHALAIPFGVYRHGMPWESIEPLSPRQLADFAAAVRTAFGARYDASLMDVFFAGAADVSVPQDWVDQKVTGRRAIDSLFGVHLLETRAHEVWGGPFLAQMLLDADRFIACYNAALEEYRRQLHIKGTQHPIPNLVRHGDRLELPIWAVRPGLPRQRVFVNREGDRIAVFAEDDPIGTVSAADLRRWSVAQASLAGAFAAGIRPRALTLTIWARLFLADLFIHGIGGAKYDRITDIFIRRYYEIEPPGICCVSATLRLDLPAHPVSDKDLDAARHRLYDVRHNPQRYLERSPNLEPLLAAEKALIVRGDVLRRDARRDHFLRRHVYEEIRRVKAELLAAETDLVDRLSAQRDRVSEYLAENKILRSREYFIGLFRRQDLQFLCEQLPSF
jgi:hypothetical protein